MRTGEWPEGLVEALFSEDVPCGDLTTRALGIGGHPARMRLSLRRSGRVCGTELALGLIRRAGGEGQVWVPSGITAEAGEEILSARGDAAALHAGWKVAQTLVEALTGIASATAAMVEAARAVAPHVAIVTTRKTFPGTKRLMIEAIRAGGAEPHRLGLSETVLIFPEHRVFLVDPVAAISRVRQAMPEKKVVVEVCSLEEAAHLLAGCPDILQCEKMTPEEIRQVVALARAHGVLVAAAGGVNALNAADYARAGAAILVTSAPYWAAPADVKVVIEPA